MLHSSNLYKYKLIYLFIGLIVLQSILNLSTLAAPIIEKRTPEPSSLVPRASYTIPPIPGVASLGPIPLGGPTGSKADISNVMAIAVNAMRLANGIMSPLVPNRQLAVSCVNHAIDMARNKFLSHTGSDGSSSPLRARKAGYTFKAIRENIAAGQTSLVQVMISWMNSSGHRTNILATNIRDFASAVAKGSDGKFYWIQCFGSK